MLFWIRRAIDHLSLMNRGLKARSDSLSLLLAHEVFGRSPEDLRKLFPAFVAVRELRGGARTRRRARRPARGGRCGGRAKPARRGGARPARAGGTRRLRTPRRRSRPPRRRAGRAAGSPGRARR